MDENNFWMVWNPQRQPPSHRHPTRHAAEQEAERLALLQPGHKFYVLEALSFCQHRMVSWSKLHPTDEQLATAPL